MSNADMPLFKSILLPSLSFMSFPLGNAIILQGYTLVVNSYFGADSVVLYNTTRTLCNFVKTFLGTLQNAVWPEYSIAYGNRNFNLMRHLHRKILKMSVFLSLIIGVSLLLLGPIIFKVWTQNTIVFNYSLMTTYIVVLFVESFWTSSSVTLMATNSHTKLGIVYILASLFSMSMALFAAMVEMPLWIIASTLIILHSIVACFSIKEGLKLTNDSLKKVFI